MLFDRFIDLLFDSIALFFNQPFQQQFFDHFAPPLRQFATQIADPLDLETIQMQVYVLHQRVHGKAGWDFGVVDQEADRSADVYVQSHRTGHRHADRSDTQVPSLDTSGELHRQLQRRIDSPAICIGRGVSLAGRGFDDDLGLGRWWWQDRNFVSNPTPVLDFAVTPMGSQLQPVHTHVDACPNAFRFAPIFVALVLPRHVPERQVA